MNSQRRRILVLSQTNMGCFRELLKGISAYAHNEGHWRLQVCGRREDAFQEFEVGAPDGCLLGPIASDGFHDELLRADVPTVCMCWGESVSGEKAPSVEADDIAVGVLAARHFLEKGFRYFGFVGVHSGWSDQRREGFEQTILAAGHT